MHRMAMQDWLIMHRMVTKVQPQNICKLCRGQKHFTVDVFT